MKKFESKIKTILNDVDEEFIIISQKVSEPFDDVKFYVFAKNHWGPLAFESLEKAVDYVGFAKGEKK